MRMLAGLLVLVTTSIAAAAPNPYTTLSAPELRTRIAAIDEVHQEKWYQVEVLVFARKGLASREYWRLDRNPALAPDNAIQPAAETVMLPEHATEIVREAAGLGAWRFLPEDQLVLDPMLERMQGSGKFRPLFHAAWVQPIQEKNQAFPLYIHGGDAIPLEAEPVLPDETGLEPGLPPMQLDAVADPSMTLQPEPVEGPFGQDAFMAPATQPELQGMLKLHLGRYLHVEPSLWFTSTGAEGQRFWVRIDQNRRMRSEELHYIDHPLFGMLIRITPYQTDAQKELELLSEALKAKQQR